MSDIEVALSEFEGWDEETKAEAIARIKANQDSQWRPFFCSDLRCSGDPHGTGDGWDFNHARADQRLPRWTDDSWLTTLVMSGRGAGKTKMGAENVHRIAKRVPYIALIGTTSAATRNVMVEGLSGLLRTANPNFYPAWSPAKGQLVWPNGALAQCYSAEEPDRIRGANLAFAWLDEAAFMGNIDDVWMNLLLALRWQPAVGSEPNPNHVLITTTPTPTEWIRKLSKDPKTIVRRVSTYANKKNLSATFWDKVTSEFEGTRMGRQELHGEILEDVVGALWAPSMMKLVEADEVPRLTRVIVSIDPAGSANKRSDATGIIVVGRSSAGQYYVLEDGTDIYSPAGWANKAVQLGRKYAADAIIAEKNYGGDMVKYTLESQLGQHQAEFRVMLVESRRGKDLRAEPVVGLYEKGLVNHVRGLDKLETEQTTWVPSVGASPNRVDALVHGLTELSRRYHGKSVLRGPGGVSTAQERRNDEAHGYEPPDLTRVPGILLPGRSQQGLVRPKRVGRIIT